MRNSFSIVFTLFVTLALFIITQSSSVGVSLLLFLILGIASVKIISPNKQVESVILNVFFITFSVYLLYASVIYLGYEYNNFKFYFFPDQGYFYDNSNELINLQSIKDVYNETIVKRVHYENEGAFFLFGSIAYLANTYFDGNSVFLQIIFTSFTGILTIVFVSRTLYYYQEDLVKLKKNALIFAFLSPLFFYSSFILRDVHICLMYAISLYLIHQKFKLLNIIYLIILFFIVKEFRLENALFLLSFIVFYVFTNRNSNSLIKKIYPFIFITGIAATILAINFLLKDINNSVQSFEMYENYTESKLNDGFGAVLYKLPFGIKQLALIINSQLTPLPPWSFINFRHNIFIMLSGLVMTIVTIFWSILFISSVFSLVIKKAFKNYEFKFIFLLLLFFLFLLLNTSNINVRRLMPMYPILFFLFVSLKQTKHFKQIFSQSSVIYLSLVSLYIFLKVFL